jgi:hypothetical protein
MAATVHVQCDNCGAWTITEEQIPDVAIRCTTGHGEPEGSVEGSCCTDGHTHEEHIAHVTSGHQSGSTCRPVTITIMGGVVMGAGERI